MLWTILIGFVVGLMARMLRPGPDPSGFIVTTLIGIAGAVVGAFIGRAVGFYNPQEPAGFMMSVIGAIAVLIIYHLATGKKAVTH